ncbi:unnamed protein product [Hyaloperonospora brassicae]|uniref:BAG domain-containing protein n=1 Tax=Hyaloperonospora brassicae TaxID=162125 RepID=A0AAV0UNI2_HYABA|nr:unnamed protein product [Hyaloperonospora brassicae]
MELQTSQPMDETRRRLQSIEANVRIVQDTLRDRLPAQYRHVAAIVCGSKWRLQTFRSLETAAAIVKRARVELGAFDYRVKEQAELLTRSLLELDDVLSYGDGQIKSARKTLVVFIQQQLLPLADAWKDRSARLKAFGELVLTRVRPLSGRADSTLGEQSDVESDGMHVSSLFGQESDGQESDDGEKESGEERKEEEQEGEEDEEEEEEEDDEEEGEEDDDEEEEEEVDDEEKEDREEEDEDMDEDVDAKEEVESSVALAASGKTDSKDEETLTGAPQMSPPLESAPATCPSQDVDVQSLPVWRPYYQLQRRQDGVYLIARLNHIDPRNVRVQWNAHSGVLRVSGFRLPTQKDVVMSRLSGAPTFGRFEITEQFPRNMLNMDEATQQISETGVLQIRMPFYVAPHPLRYRPASFYQPQDCFVW